MYARGFRQPTREAEATEAARRQARETVRAMAAPITPEKGKIEQIFAKD